MVPCSLSPSQQALPSSPFFFPTKSDFFICFTINEGIHEEYGFDKKIEQLNKDNKWKEIEFFKSDYIASKDVNAWLGLYEVIK